MPRDYTVTSGKGNGNYKTGYSIRDKDGKRLGFYNTWQNMKGRCLNPNNPKYKNYGARGIKICDSWLDINNFAEWSLNNGWKPGLSLDRIDNNKDYNPENCEWVTVAANSRKKSTTKINIEQANEIRIRYKTEKISMKDLAKDYNISVSNVGFIINNFIHVSDGECTKKFNSLPSKQNP